MGRRLTSAGLLMYRRGGGGLEVLLVHPGGPFWADKDEGAWSIPKGQTDAADADDLLATARREFAEELGFEATGPFLPLGSVRLKSGKVVHAWAFAGDCDATQCRSNTTRVEWPPRSGKWVTIPEVDRAEFFPLDAARRKLNPAQAALVDALERAVETPA